ncbi:MAG: ferritin-like domain-containing protein [Helicobacteraceae bacterium]
MNYDQNILDAKAVAQNADTPPLAQALRIALYDEYKAYEMYRAIIARFGNQRPFSNIIQAEAAHIESISYLCAKYGVPLPENDAATKIALPSSLQECCQMGVQAEIDNINMYNNLLPYASGDVLDVFYRVQAASANNHLPALSACLGADLGVDLSGGGGGFAPTYQDLYTFAKNNLGVDLDAIIPQSLRSLLPNLSGSLAIGAIIGAGAVFLLNKTNEKGQ